MIKCESIGMIQIAKNNPVLKVNAVAHNYDFIAKDGVQYIVLNELTGDDAYKPEAEFKANENLNGFDLEAWIGMNFLCDEKHIVYGTSESYADIVAGTTLLGINSDGKLAIISSAPSSGFYFKVLEKDLTLLAPKALRLKINRA